MNGIRSGIIALGALAVLGAAQVAAQDIESIMRARERLELTETQLESLEVIRREAVLERTTELAQMQELRSQLHAGQIRRSEVMAFMEDRREARQGLTEQRREQLAAVLDESQLERVQEMRQRRGRASGRAGVRGSQRPFRGPPRASLRDARTRGAIGDRPFAGRRPRR